MFLTFLGANETVTGSKTLLETARGRLLVDCGLFQGTRDLRLRNWKSFPIPPNEITAVALSHAHLDHCGYLPALTRDGFEGPIFCTPNTAALAAIVLRDSARLQEEDAEFARRKGFSKHAEPRALYGPGDAERAIAMFRPIEFGVDFTALTDITGRFDPAGHILGSSIITLTDGTKTVVFSGDLGRSSHPLLIAPAAPSAADAIVIESTYGNREHPDFDAELEAMAAAITRTIKRGGTVVIPAFAVDRTEVLLKALHDLQDTQRIPRVPIHVDSPMALAAMRVYRAAIVDRDPEIRTAAVVQGPDIIEPQNLFESTTPDESKRLDLGGARIIVSASGMGTGGRVVHHLKALLPNPDNTVIIAGYQAVGTRGRSLLDGAREIKVHGRYVRVKAEIVDIRGFSVHADASELIAWLRAAGQRPEQVFVIHGEPEASAALARRVSLELDVVAVVPKTSERIAIY